MAERVICKRMKDVCTQFWKESWRKKPTGKPGSRRNGIVKMDMCEIG
jgi:hypothetical protein